MIRKMVIVGVGAALLLVVSVIARPAGREGAPSARKRPGPSGMRGPDAGPECGTTAAPVLTESEESPREEAARPTPPEETAQPTGDSFWDDVASLLAARLTSDPAEHRKAMLARTAAYLGLEGNARTSFSELASSVADEIDRAWAVREHLVLTLPPDREEAEQTIHEAYEESKRRALGRLESILRATAEHQEFREKMEEWIDAVR